jgi:hypothetical protein
VLDLLLIDNDVLEVLEVLELREEQTIEHDF